MDGERTRHESDFHSLLLVTQAIHYGRVRSTKLGGHVARTGGNGADGSVYKRRNQVRNFHCVCFELKLIA